MARIATYHFGCTYQAECATCSCGTADGDDEGMALARMRGKMLDYADSHKV